MPRAGNLGIYLSLALLAACGSESPNAPPSGPTFAYVLDRRLPNYNFVLSAYKVDTSTGTWTLVGSIPDLTNVSLDPQGHFLVAKPLGEYDCCCDYCSRPKTLVTYGIDPLTGVLSSPSVKVLFQGAGAEIVTIHPSSRFLLVRTDRPCSIEAVEINSMTGTLKSTLADLACGSFTEWEAGDGWVALEPTGRFLYYGRCDDPRSQVPVARPIFGYQLDVETGNLSYVGEWAAGGCFAIDPSGRHLYSSMPVTGQLSQFAIDATTGNLTATSLTSSLKTPGSLVVHPSGRFLYLASGSDIEAYQLDSAGVPSLFGVVAKGVTATSPSDHLHPTYAYPECTLALDPAGRYLYVLRSADVLGYSINATTGALQPIHQAEGGRPGTVAAWDGTWGLWIGLVAPAH